MNFPLKRFMSLTNNEKKLKVHWFFNFRAMFRCIDPKEGKTFLFSLHFHNCALFHPPRNSPNDDKRIFPFLPCVSSWRSEQKIRRYRIKVLSTPRWTSRYNQVVPSATLAQWKFQSFFFSSFSCEKKIFFFSLLFVAWKWKNQCENHSKGNCDEVGESLIQIFVSVVRLLLGGSRWKRKFSLRTWEG